VATSVSLGEKRFVAVIQVDGLQFLVGGGATNVVLLAQLNGEESFSKVFNETMSAPKKQPAKRVKKRAAKPAVARMGEQA
jgi:flagellar biogenesis protein FliO